MSWFLLAEAAPASKTMYLLVDILVCLWLVGGIIIGAKKGFVECFFKLISTIAALVLAIMFAAWLLDLTNGLFGLQEKLNGVFSVSFDSVKGFDEEVYNVERLQIAINELKLPKALGNMVIKFFNKNYSIEQLETAPPIAAEVFGGALAELLCLVIAGIVLFIIAKILLKLLRKILTALVEKLSAIRVLNAILGTLMGAIQTLINIWIVLAIVSALPVEGINTFMANCTVLGFLADHNVLMNLITAFL